MNKIAYLLGKQAADQPVSINPATWNSSRQSILGHEGALISKPKIVTNGETYPTVGFGTSLSPDKSNMVERVTGQPWHNMLEGKVKVTPNIANQFLDYDLSNTFRRVSQAVPGYTNLLPNTQTALLDNGYRAGVFGPKGSPKTLNFINQGLGATNTVQGARAFNKAGPEFLNNNEYRNAVALGRPGIIPRMNTLRDALLQEGAVRTPAKQ